MALLGLLVFSIGGALFSCTLLILGLFIGIVFRIPKKGGLDVQRKEPVIKLVFFIIIASAIFLAVSVLGFLASLLLWVYSDLLSLNTPERLALASVIFGGGPLMVACLGAGVARVMGISLNEGGVKTVLSVVWMLEECSTVC